MCHYMGKNPNCSFCWEGKAALAQRPTCLHLFEQTNCRLQVFITANSSASVSLLANIKFCQKISRCCHWVSWSCWVCRVYRWVWGFYLQLSGRSGGFSSFCSGGFPSKQLPGSCLSFIVAALSEQQAKNFPSHKCFPEMLGCGQHYVPSAFYCSGRLLNLGFGFEFKQTIKLQKPSISQWFLAGNEWSFLACQITILYHKP